MKQFLIYTNRHKDRNLEVTSRIERYLTEKGHTCIIKMKDADWKKDKESGSGEDIPLSGIDFMLVLGGDGTVLQAVRDTGQYNIPMLGVNLGTLGYMTEVEPDTLEESLTKLLEGDYELESRMMLNARVDAGVWYGQEGWALNDVVIGRCGSLRIIEFNIFVNGQFLKRYSADGVIITTPTGSTGYNLSAGGPIVEPKAELIVLTPISPHTLNQRSIILSPQDEIIVEIPLSREGEVQEVEATFDGSQAVRLHSGDRVKVMKSDRTTEFVKLNKISFLDVLHKKMRES